METPLDDLLRTRQFDDAEMICRQQIEKDPKHPMGYYNLAVVYEKRNETEEAIKLLKKSYKMSKPSMARGMILKNLGILHSEMGRFDMCERYQRKALKINPQDVGSWASIAHNRKWEDGEIVDELLLALERVSDGMPKSTILFSLGKVHDDMGEYDKAFEYYREANDLNDKGYNFQIWDHILEELKMCDQALAEDFSKWGSDDENQIFVLGMPRSGTTLVDRILCKNGISSVGEFTILPYIKRHLTAISGEQFMVKNIIRNSKEMRGLADAYLESVPEGKVINKVPNNFCYLAMIQAMFPKAKIVHCMRNPVDTGLSCYFQYFAHFQEWSFNLENIVKFTKIYRRFMQHAKENLLLDIYDVQYEDIISSEEAREGLVKFVGKGHGETISPVRTASIWQSRQPIYNTSVGRWKNYERHIKPLLQLND